MSRGDFPDDTFTENDVLTALESAGLRYKRGGRYILSQCPTHDDENPSVQIYKDDWFVNCHAGCGRFHITKAFPELRSQSASGHGESTQYRPRAKAKPMTEHKYIEVDLMEMWEKMEEIPEDHLFKGIEIDTLNYMGWRYDPIHERYFIPYFSRSRTTIPFGQWRNLREGPRFNFWKDAKPTMYGTWNLDPANSPIFLVEGASDAAVMETCAIPWVAAPSAASKELVKTMATWCEQQGIVLVFAGDNDDAGAKVREALDEVTAYRVCQPPKEYKDWGDFYENAGHDAVYDYCWNFLQPKKVLPENERPENWEELTDVEKVQHVFPGAEQLEIINSEPSEARKELLEGPEKF